MEGGREEGRGGRKGGEGRTDERAVSSSNSSRGSNGCSMVFII